MSVEAVSKNPSSILRWPIVRGDVSVSFSAENNKLVGRIHNSTIPSEKIKCGINGSTPHSDFIEKIQQVAEQNIAIYAYSPQGQPPVIWIFEAFPTVIAKLINRAKEFQRQNNPTNLEDTILQYKRALACLNTVKIYGGNQLNTSELLTAAIAQLTIEIFLLLFQSAHLPNQPNPLYCLKRALLLISTMSDPFALPHFLEKLDHDWMTDLLKTNKDPDLERWILQKDAVRMAFEQSLIELSNQDTSTHEPTCFICFNVDEPDVGKWLEHMLVPDLDRMGIRPLFCFRDLGPGKGLNNFQKRIRTADAVILAYTPDLKRKCVERKRAPTGVALEIELAEGRHGDIDKHEMTFPLYLKGGIHSACPSEIFAEDVLGTNFTFFDNSKASSIFSYYAGVFELFGEIRKIPRKISRGVRDMFLKQTQTILQKDGFDPDEVNEVKKWRQERASKNYQILKAVKDRVSTSIQMVRLPLPPKNFTGREQELTDLREACEKHHRVAITGLGGIGKTALAIAYGDTHKSGYQFVYFIPASTSQMVIQGLLQLADELNLPKVDNLEEGLCLLKRTLEQFEQKYLIIFDGVDQVEAFHELEKYLPQTGHCLVTSRMPGQSRAQGFNQIPLEPLKADEAVKYLLLATRSKEAKEAEELVEKLGRLPLALTHAARYISGQETTISRYVEQFMLNDVKLQDGRYFELTNREKTILTTWTLSMEIIKRVHNCSISKDLLDFFAFLGQAPIPRELIKTWGKHSYPEYEEHERENAIRHLLGYSMIESSYPDTFTIHPLVQSVARHQLSLENQRKVIERAFTSLTAQLELLGQEKNVTNSGLSKLCIPHAMALFNRQNLITWMSLEAQFKFMKHLGKISLEMGSMPGVLDELSRQCLQITEKWRTEPSSQQACIAIAWSYNFRGLILKDLGKAKESLICFERALESLRRVYDEEHPHVATCYNNMGVALQDLGRLQESLNYLKIALDIRSALYRQNPNHPDIAQSNNNMGQVLQNLGNLEEALVKYQKALEIWSSLYGEKHPLVARCNLNLGSAHHAIGIREEKHEKMQIGLILYQKALEALTSLYGENHPDVATANNSIGTAHQSLGEIEMGLVYYEKAFKIRGILYQQNPLHPAIAISYYYKGCALKALGQLPDAIDFFKKAIDIWERHSKQDRPDIGRVYNDIGEAYEDSKETEIALEYYIKALNIIKNYYKATHPIMQQIVANISRLGTKDPNLLHKVLCKTPLSVGKPPGERIKIENSPSAIGPQGYSEERKASASSAELQTESSESPINIGGYGNIRDSQSYALPLGFIRSYDTEVGKLTNKQIAQYFWLNSAIYISDAMVKKVNAVAVYLKKERFILKGVKADGNCFCEAFLKSYESLSQKIPILDIQQNKISYLRDMIASQYTSNLQNTNAARNRAEQIKKSGEWLTASGEGDLLAIALSIPIRIVTVNEEDGNWGINDMLTFPDQNKGRQEWGTLNESEKPKSYILIVDLVGHFISGHCC